MENKNSLIMAIINSGYSDKVMDIATSKGARGGTILNAVGSVGENAAKLYGIVVSEDKEIVMIVVPNALCDKILQALYEGIGPATEAQGIAFSLPVEETTLNLSSQYNKKTENK